MFVSKDSYGMELRVTENDYEALTIGNKTHERLYKSIFKPCKTNIIFEIYIQSLPLSTSLYSS